MNIICIILAAILAPLLPGVVNQTKAFFAGRRGPGFFRLYIDLWKYLHKSCLRPTSSTWIFDLAPIITLASTLAAAIVFPWVVPSFGLAPATSAAVFFYLLGVGRFFTVLGALDAGNAFEGMGASREVQFSALVEPIVFVILGFLTMLTGETSIAGMLDGTSITSWARYIAPISLIALAFFAVLLCENSRVPFDDPETHLELTMIHEAMLLDVGGPDLAFALYGAALKLELMVAFFVLLFIPSFGDATIIRILQIFIGTLAMGVVVGIVESTMARMRFLKTPQVLMGAMLVAALAVFLIIKW